jgi:DNA-directed RNA polymerase specialized sigma24 family protein
MGRQGVFWKKMQQDSRLGSLSNHMASLEQAFRRFRETGDPEALARVFDGSAAELFRVAMHLVGDPHLAEDLVQTTFLVAIREAGSFAGSSVSAWLMGILTNRVHEARRDASRRPDPERFPPRPQPGPRQHAEAAELSRAVRDGIAGLPVHGDFVQGPDLPARR